MKSVLITGATGFLGSKCAIFFKKANYEVITTDRYGSVDIQGDLSDNIFVENLPQVDIVVNCAAVQYVSNDLPFFKRRSYFRKNNIESAINLLNQYLSKNTHFIHIGTSMMYAQNESDVYDENSLMAESGIYSKSKLEAQSYIEKLPNVATIIPCIIGGIGREGLFRSFINSINYFNVGIFPGLGRYKISIVHVDDVARLIVKVAETASTGYFNASAENPLTIRQWINLIAQQLNKPKTIKFSIPLSLIKFISQIFAYRLLAKEQLLMLSMPHVLDISKSKSIGWSPVFSSDEIIQQITNHVISSKKSSIYTK